MGVCRFECSVEPLNVSEVVMNMALQSLNTNTNFFFAHTHTHTQASKRERELVVRLFREALSD